MRIISPKDAVFSKIEASLADRQEEIELEFLAGIDCDDLDIANQQDLGDNDPIATIELVAQWLPETGEGLLDWFYLRVSQMEDKDPEIQHGGSLLAFNAENKIPDLDALIDKAVKALNEEIKWAEFELEEDTES